MKPLTLLLAFVFASSLHAQAVKLTATTEGVVVDGGAGGRVVLRAPMIGGADKKDRKAVFTPADDGASATAAYADGTVVKITFSAEGAVTYSFGSVPPNAITLKIIAALPRSFSVGGSYVVDKSEAKPFPGETGKQIFAQGAFSYLEFISGTGDGISFTVPASYQQLQDPRAWGMQEFHWVYHYDFLRYPEATQFILTAATVKKAVAAPATN